jgi:hypothetical protein
LSKDKLRMNRTEIPPDASQTIRRTIFGLVLSYGGFWNRGPPAAVQAFLSESRLAQRIASGEPTEHRVPEPKWVWLEVVSI